MGYEFGGPVNVFFMMIGLPAVIYGLYFFCGRDNCSIAWIPSSPPSLQEFFNWQAMAVYILWFTYHMIIYLSPLGYYAKGLKLKDGSRLEYKMNGIHAFLLTHILFAVAWYLDIPVTFVYNNYLALATSAIVFSAILSIFLYIKSFNDGAILAEGGNTGNVVYDFFIGRELNPRIGLFDLKVFCEMRPGLIGWVFINYCCMVKEYELRGTVSVSMLLVCLFQFWYILDALWYEEAILTTMDIIHDGFGYMLCFGDLAWVPFTYSLQARYLVDHPTLLPAWAVVVIVIIKLTGYTIFRGANGQKDQFRRDPNSPKVKHLETLTTERGTKLMISGYWGVCRHPNYVGDILMALSWSLPCGFDSILPYFYVTYFTCLLIHRQLRDEKHCKAKYGNDWDKYCKIVKWRLIPYLY